MNENAEELNIRPDIKLAYLTGTLNTLRQLVKGFTAQIERVQAEIDRLKGHA